MIINLKKGEPNQLIIRLNIKMGKAKKIVQESEEEEELPSEEEEIQDEDQDDEEEQLSEEAQDQSEDYEEEQPKKKNNKKPLPKKSNQKSPTKTPSKAPAKKKQPEAKASASKTKQVTKGKTTPQKNAGGNKQNRDEKKKHFLPGQKFQTPDEQDGARAFYTSLYSQNPKSEMAKKYCLEYGLLEKDEANKVLKELARKK